MSGEGRDPDQRMDPQELDLRKAARLLARIILDESVLGVADADLGADVLHRDEGGRFKVGPADAAATGDVVPLAKTDRDLGLDILAALNGETVNHRQGQEWTG